MAIAFYAKKGYRRTKVNFGLIVHQLFGSRIPCDLPVSTSRWSPTFWKKAYGLIVEMLCRHLTNDYSAELKVEQLCSPYRRRATILPFLGKKRVSINADRLANRMWDYPRYLRGRRDQFDLFHVADHSYSQLVHVLPADRTGIYCHDLDTFRCLLEPGRDPRPRWFRAVIKRVLDGFQRAALVFYSTDQIRQEIERHGLIDSKRLVHAPPGCLQKLPPSRLKTMPKPPVAVAALGGSPFLLHVGSCIPRKRIDVLLDVFAGARQHDPRLRLVKVGVDWSGEQRSQIDRLGLAPHIIPLQGLTRHQIAALYRAAALVLQPSESEGFGLPVIEALACGSIVVASDLPVLREVAGAAAVYQPVGDVAAWVSSILDLLGHPETAPAAALRFAQASKFTWANHTRTIVDAYRRLLA